MAAVPVQTDTAINSGVDVPAPTATTVMPTNSAYVCFSPGTSGVTKTCNLQTDTMHFIADGSVWDSTQGAWISSDILSRRPTPRVPDGN